MTDKEIIKALEYCNSTERGHCLNKCPYYNYSANCTQEMIKDTLDLIKRQQAEIERLKMEREAFDDAIYPLPFKTDFDIAIETAKSEAYKEFAERLKIKCGCVPQYHFNILQVEFEINNLVKELTEEVSNG